MRRVILALWAVGLLACDRHGTSGEPSKSTAIDAAPPPSSAPASRESVYQLRPSLLDQDGMSIGLDVFRGHPVIVSMFYGHCKSACPLLISSVRLLESQLAVAERAELRVLLVSFDAERDTPPVLTKLVADHQVDAARWRLASAKADDARTLSAVLGIQYRRLDDGEFAHNSVLTLLDRAGNVVTSTEDLQPPSEDFMARVRATLAK